MYKNPSIGKSVHMINEAMTFDPKKFSKLIAKLAGGLIVDKAFPDPHHGKMMTASKANLHTLNAELTPKMLRALAANNVSLTIDGQVNFHQVQK